MKRNVPPYCRGAEQYCFSFMKNGSIVCEDCEYNIKTMKKRGDI